MDSERKPISVWNHTGKHDVAKSQAFGRELDLRRGQPQYAEERSKTKTQTTKLPLQSSFQLFSCLWQPVSQCLLSGVFSLMTPRSKYLKALNLGHRAMKFLPFGDAKTLLSVETLILFWQMTSAFKDEVLVFNIFRLYLS